MRMGRKLTAFFLIVASCFLNPSSVQGQPDMLPAFLELFEQNQNIVGWLQIEGTRIDYPVMQKSGDPEYYLEHGFNDKKSKNGLLVLDAQCAIGHSDVLLIHGHNMKSGFMFGGLKKYKKEAYFKEHPIIRFDTLYEKAEYEVIAVILARVYRTSEDVFKYYRVEGLDSEAAFDAYIGNLKALSLYETGTDAQYGDKLIVLSTCERSIKNGRLAVVARKIQ